MSTMAAAGAPAWSPRRPWAGGWLLVALLVQMGAGGLLFLADRHRPATAPRGRTLVEMRWLPSLHQTSETSNMPRTRSAPTPSAAPRPSAQDRTPRKQAFVAPSTPGAQTDAPEAPESPEALDQRPATKAASPSLSGLTARPAPLVLLLPSAPASAPPRPTLMEQLKADPRAHSAPRDLAYRMADAAGTLPQVIQSSTSATGSSLVKRGSACQRVYENRMKSLSPTDERLKDAPSVAGNC